VNAEVVDITGMLTEADAAISFQESHLSKQFCWGLTVMSQFHHIMTELTS